MSPDPAADKLNDQFEATVVVPALNAEGTLGVTLQAIDQQSIRDRLRVIVVDNGSTDSTVSIAEAFVDHVVIEPAQGIAHARNAGLIVCRTPWMLTTDADTRPQRDWAAQHLRHLVQCAPDVIATAGRIIPFPSSSWWAQREDVTPHPSVRAGRLQYAVTVNAAFRAKSVRELGGFPSYFADDAAFGEVARGAGYRFVSLPGAVVEHRNPETAYGYYRQMWKIGRYAAQLEGPPANRLRFAARGGWRALKASRHFVTGRPRHGAAECLKAVGVTRGALSMRTESLR